MLTSDAPSHVLAGRMVVMWSVRKQIYYQTFQTPFISTSTPPHVTRCYSERYLWVCNVITNRGHPRALWKGLVTRVSATAEICWLTVMCREAWWLGPQASSAWDQAHAPQVQDRLHSEVYLCRVHRTLISLLWIFKTLFLASLFVCYNQAQKVSEGHLCCFWVKDAIQFKWGHYLRLWAPFTRITHLSETLCTLQSPRSQNFQH